MRSSIQLVAMHEACIGCCACQVCRSVAMHALLCRTELDPSAIVAPSDVHMSKTVFSEKVTFMLYCSYFIFMRLPLSSSPGLGSLLFPNHLRSPEYHDTTWPSDYLPACLHDLKTHPYNFWWYTVALTLTSPFTIWCRSMIIEQVSKIFHEL